MDVNVMKKKLNFYNVRKDLYEEKCKIRGNSSVYVNDIDQAINLACRNYKIAHKLYASGKIKKFRLRHWRKQKSSQYMDISHERFNNIGFVKKELGKVKALYNGKKCDFSNVECWCKLIYKNNKYYLYSPEKIKLTCPNANKNTIALDPGIRTFMTGISQNDTIEICDNLYDVVSKQLKRKDAIMGNEKIPINIKKNWERRINNKIKNKVNELHWKSINFLISNYKNIFIGNMSSKNISSKSYSLPKMCKRVALHANLFKYRERLKYKCFITGTNYKLVKEWMTSLTCSCCGNVKTKKELGTNKTYKCSLCSNIMDRDVNAARNMLLKCL
jgi:putative transposase